MIASVLILNVTMVLANLSVLAMCSTHLMKEMKKVK
jgi:hypothetical protein